MNISDILAAVTDIDFSQGELHFFHEYAKLLVAANEVINLTTITDNEGIAIKHFLDSLMLLKATPFPEGSMVLDVGTGAGLPGIPLRIHRPELKITLLDSIGKKVRFLQDTCIALGFEDVKVLKGRAEELGRDHGFRNSYDRVVARAVKPLNILCEYSIPFLKKGGLFLAMKGPDVEGETAEAEGAIRILGGRIADTFAYSLPYGAGNRSIIVIEKVSKTPDEYPRRPGIPEKRPL